MDPSLYKAATQGDVETLKKLVEKDVKVLNSRTPQLNTALHVAALHGHAPFARVLLSVGEELLAARNKEGDTPLHLAARSGKLKVAELLVGLSQHWPVDPSADGELGDTPFKGPLIMRNVAGNTPLHEAAGHSRSAVAVMLLDADPSHGYDLNGMEESPLDLASREGLLHVVRKIVELPWVAEPAGRPTVSGTALHQAVLGRHTRILEVLVEKRPDMIERTDSFGNNALHYAAQKNHSQAMGLLLNCKTILAHQLNDERQTPLHIAALHGSTDVIKALLRLVPDAAEMVDSRGRNAFHLSVSSGKASALLCLLRRNGGRAAEEPLNRVDADGNTPLHLATSMGHVQCALLLLRDRRVDPCVRDRGGNTARSLLEAKLATGEMNTYELELLNQLKQQEYKRCRMQNLPPAVRVRRRPLSNKDFDSVVDAYFLAATLIATVSFAATFTMPGGYDQTRGIVLHGRSTVFRTFVVSNTVAMCSSIVVIFLLIWARQEPIKLRLHNLYWSQILTIVACLAMLLSLMTNIYVTVAPIATWPAYAVIAIATSSPALFFLITWIGTW